jgi:hypothetical protein
MLGLGAYFNGIDDQSESYQIAGLVQAVSLKDSGFGRRVVDE